MNFFIINKKNKLGFTLVELIVAAGLLGLIITIIGGFVNFSSTFERKAEREFDFQSSMRQASRVLNNEIRSSSVTFTLTDEVFAGDKKDKWNYLGVENNKEIVQYIWNSTKDNGDGTFGGHDRIILVPSNENISYNLTFSQTQPGSKLLQFNLEGIDDENQNKKLIISSELAAMNALVVDDGGSLENPAVAVAYRSDHAPTPEVVTTGEHAAMLITLVLDDSGSMDYDMLGHSPGSWNFDNNNVRKNIMKNEAKKLIDKFASLGNIKVSIVPFANTANDPINFVDCTDETKENTKSVIQGFDANGGTNTGDGLRRAYYKIEDYNNVHTGDEIVNYIILLTDGNPTFRSSSNSHSYSAKTSDGNVDNNCVFGTGQESTNNINSSMEYVDAIGQSLVVGKNLDIRTFVIGFTAVSDGVTRAIDIAEDSCTNHAYQDRFGTYYSAGSDIELEAVFNEITTTILQETWHIYGPY